MLQKFQIKKKHFEVEHVKVLEHDYRLWLCNGQDN